MTFRAHAGAVSAAAHRAAIANRFVRFILSGDRRASQRPLERSEGGSIASRFIGIPRAVCRWGNLRGWNRKVNPLLPYRPIPEALQATP